MQSDAALGHRASLETALKTHIQGSSTGDALHTGLAAGEPPAGRRACMRAVLQQDDEHPWGIRRRCARACCLAFNLRCSIRAWRDSARGGDMRLAAPGRLV